MISAIKKFLLIRSLDLSDEEISEIKTTLIRQPERQVNEEEIRELYDTFAETMRHISMKRTSITVAMVTVIGSFLLFVANNFMDQPLYYSLQMTLLGDILCLTFFGYLRNYILLSAASIYVMELAEEELGVRFSQALSRTFETVRGKSYASQRVVDYWLFMFFFICCNGLPLFRFFNGH